MLELKLQELLADLFIFYMKVYKYHWNLKGPGFIYLHKFYGETFDETSEIIDELAERMRGLGYYAPCSCLEFIELASIKEEKGFSLKEDNTIEIIIEDLEVIINKIIDLYKLVDEATLSLLNNYECKLSKRKWFLESLY